MKHIAEYCLKGSKSLIFSIAILFSSTYALNTAQADEIENLKKQFGQLYQEGKFREVLGTIHKLEAIVKAKLGEGHVRHIKILDRMSTQYMIIGKKKISEKFLKQAISLAEAKHGKDSQIAMETRSTLGVLYVGQNRKEEALAQFKAASVIAEKVLGADNMETKALKSNIAWLQK